MAAPARAQTDTAVAPPRKAPRGAQLLLPLGSLVLLPGLGQYVQGAPLAGAGFTTAFLAGYGLYRSGDASGVSLDPAPRSPDGQRSFLGAQLYVGSAMLSAYDSFHRSVPRLQGEGKYAFVRSHESTGSLLAAPFDFRLAKRWTTLVDLAYTGVVTAIIVAAETSPGKAYAPFRAHDGLFIAGLSYGAGVGEEALFRGWLYPVLHQNLGQQFWLSNSLQAASFGGLHAGQAGPFAFVIGGWALYEGWLTRRNGWSIRESVFHHFWYDVAVATATLLTEDSASVAVRFPPVRF